MTEGNGIETESRASMVDANSCSASGPKSSKHERLQAAQAPILQSRGVGIARVPGQIRRVDSRRYGVRSQSRDKWYNVTWEKRFWRCDCPFSVQTHKTCKHIYAVLHRISDTESEVKSELCPQCKRSDKIVRRGFYKSKSGLTQRYNCKRCNHRFACRTGFEGMRHTAKTITACLDLFFKGLSLRSISNHLTQIHGQPISHLTVYRWIRQYLKLILSNLHGLAPQVSQTWHADEMRIGVGGNMRNLWNLMDHRTRYLLAIQVTKRKGAAEAERLLDRGLQTSKQEKLTLISDGLISYHRAVTNYSRKKGPEIRHRADTGLTKRDSNNRLERLNETVRQRIKTMRGLDNDESSRVFARGYAAYYNHVRPHSALNGKTPGEAAKAWKPTGTNRWLSLIRYDRRREV